MNDRPTLLEARQELRQTILASEEWQPSYKADMKNFRQLLKAQAQLESDVAEYFLGLATRALYFIDWTQLPQPIRAAAVPNNSDPVWKAEQFNMQQAILDAITLVITTGGQAGELAYSIDLGLNTLNEHIMRAARDHTAQLVSGVTETTRDLIRESIQQSIARGEDVATSRDRLSKVINNPVRADLIARTEAVNGYQLGLRTFADQSGGESKEWSRYWAPARSAVL